MMGGKKEVGTNDFVGPRDVKNVNYRDYLVRRYEITKNDVLNVYSFNNQAYELIYVLSNDVIPLNFKDAGFGFFPIENSRFPTATLPSLTFSGKTPSFG